MTHPDLKPGDQIFVGGELFATVVENDGNEQMSCCLAEFDQAWWYNDHLDHLLSLKVTTVKPALPKEVERKVLGGTFNNYVHVPYPEGSLVEVVLKEAK